MRRFLPARLLCALAALALAACDAAGGEPAPGAATAPAAGATPPPAPPPTTGMDSALLARGLERALELPRLNGIVVARHGRVVAERYRDGWGPDRPANVKSVSKSLLSALVGIAIREGHLAGTEQPVAELLPEHFGPGTDSLKRRITVGHLLSMRSGLESTSFGNYGDWVTSRDWVADALGRPLVDRPGGRMLYSTGSTHVLSAALTRATGQSTLAFARRHLGEPLGVPVRAWTRDPQGVYFGGNEMRMTPREMLRFGQLYLDGGRYGGRQVVPAAWVEESLAPRTTSPWNGHGYGYGWWSRPGPGHRVEFAWGYGGQFVFLVRDLGLVVAVVSDARGTRDGGHLRAVHRLVDETLLPAAERGGGAGAPGREDLGPA